ncbi:PASTA domain-containing protein [Halomonas sp. CKK8]|uniref:PASTA domain-containing protein n=1 Tax=Halomonas sp. CKK8 TaxID=3036127 RepID=UPI0024152A33|nr:PASTA domain-containing protein [Halomonas sp. CKK8]WFM72884.1 PASTA domain-containing protein [Halomonas sp. CKK8]
MTIKLRVTASLLDAARKPAPRQVVELQVYQLGRGWMGLDRSTTNDEGRLAIGTGLQDEGKLAPALRLVKADTDPAEVLSQQGTYHMARTILNVSFGEVVMLPGAGVSAPSVSRRRPERLSGMNLNMADLMLDTQVHTLSPDSLRPGIDTATDSARPEAGGVTAGMLETRKTAVVMEMLSAETAKREQLQVQVDLRQHRIQELDQALQKSEAQSEQLGRQLDQLRKTVSTSPPMERLTSTISGALDLARADQGMELASAELRIRGLVMEGGKSFHPLDSVEAREVLSDNVSELVLRLNPPRIAAAPASAEVPDLIGQTLESARRQALAAGLRLDVIERYSQRHPSGAIIEQRPAPGADLSEADGRLGIVVAVGSDTEEAGP